MDPYAVRVRPARMREIAAIEAMCRASAKLLAAGPHRCRGHGDLGPIERRLANAVTMARHLMARELSAASGRAACRRRCALRHSRQRPGAAGMRHGSRPVSSF
jgi:hypothetical protein